MSFPISATLKTFGPDNILAVKNVSKIGISGIQMYTASGEFAPEKMTKAKRKEMLDIATSYGLVFSSLYGNFGVGFANRAKKAEHIEKSKRVLELAKDLETNIVTTHIGVVPTDNRNPEYEVMQETCLQVANYATSLGVRFAIETGYEKAVVLKNFLDGLNSRSIAVSFNPAKLVMVWDDDPVQAVYTLKDYIVCAYAKDSINFSGINPDFFHSNWEMIFYGDKHFLKKPLGEGRVDFKLYLTALEEIGYKGFLTVDCETGENSVVDMMQTVSFLKSKF